MADQELTDYIGRVLRNGGTLKEAIGKLVSAGHDESSVREAASKVKKKRFEEVGVIILGVIIVIGLVGMLINNYYSDKVVEQPTSFDNLADAIDSGDISSCDELGPAFADVCRKTLTGERKPPVPPGDSEPSIYEQAVATNNASKCEEIESTVERNRCLKYTAPEENDSDQNKSDEEIMAEAESSGDETACSEIENPNKRLLCLAKSSG